MKNPLLFLTFALVLQSASAQTLGFHAAVPVVHDRPYIAERLRRFDTMTPSGTARMEERRSVIMRDSAGRLREETEGTEPDENGSFLRPWVRVLDPLSMLQTDLDVAAKTYTRSPIPLEVKAYRQSPVIDCASRIARQKLQEAQGIPSREHYEDLGTSTILGVAATGCRIARTDDVPGRSDVTDIWISRELQINLSSITRFSDGREDADRVMSLRVDEPDAELFNVPHGYVDALAPPKRTNFNPNLDLLAEYGSIEWHSGTATLIAGGGDPLRSVAQTLEQCLGIPVSSERPFQMYTGDLLDITAPQWAAEHPETSRHAFASKPAKVSVDFPTGEDGSPEDVEALLKAAATQVNAQQPYEYEMTKVVRPSFTMYALVPNATYDEQGRLIHPSPYLSIPVTIPSQKATIAELANQMARQVTQKSGYKFNCCQALVAGQLWGMKTIQYQATEKPAREVFADLMEAQGEGQSYTAACEVRSRNFCFINVEGVRMTQRRNTGICKIAGYDPGK